VIYDSIAEAARQTSVSASNISKWSKDKKHGWFVVENPADDLSESENERDSKT
jgi:hypothetical protein